LANEKYYEQVKRVVAKALCLIDPSKPYGTELFDAVAKVSISVTIEAVCLRRNPTTRVIEVLITQRSPDDTAYPGEWHCPGSVMRPGETEKEVFARLSKDEFCAKVTPKRFVGNFNNPNERRGHFLSMVYLCTIEEEAKGTWCSVDQLHSKTVEHHLNNVIPMVVKAFMASQSVKQESFSQA